MSIISVQRGEQERKPTSIHGGGKGERIGKRNDEKWREREKGNEGKEKKERRWRGKERRGGSHRRVWHSAVTLHSIAHEEIVMFWKKE